jgi:tRNA-binding EMAP/Myf-like protein
MTNITFDEFHKLDIRVGEIKIVEEVPGADKLYKIIVDIGGEERVLVAGIPGQGRIPPPEEAEQVPVGYDRSFGRVLFY